MVTFDDYRQTAWSCAGKIGAWVHEVLVLDRDPFTAMVDLWDRQFIETNGGIGLFSPTRVMTISSASGRYGVPNGWQAGYWGCEGCGSQRFRSCHAVTSHPDACWCDWMEGTCVMPGCEARARETKKVMAEPKATYSTLRDASGNPTPAGLRTIQQSWLSRKKQAVVLAVCELLPPYMARRDGSGWVHFVDDKKTDERVEGALRIDEWKWNQGIIRRGETMVLPQVIPPVTSGPNVNNLNQVTGAMAASSNTSGGALKGAATVEPSSSSSRGNESGNGRQAETGSRGKRPVYVVLDSDSDA